MALRNVVAAGETPGEPNNGYGTVVKGTVISAPASTGIKPGTRNAQIADPSSLTGHPNILVQVGPGLRSTAFGRYQIINGTAKSNGFNDFSPTGQDAAADTLMDKRGMTSAAMNGNIQQAIQNGGREWASLPGSPYGQPTQSMDAALQTYGSSIVSSGCQQ
jgi:muramidase (phage lysozyme)